MNGFLLHNLLDMADLAASSFFTASSSTLFAPHALLFDLADRDALFVKLVVGRALLTNRIVHCTLLVDEVVLGALCQTRRHSLIERVLIDRVGRFERFGLITLLSNFCIACVDELLTG